MLRSILFPKQNYFSFYKDSMKFLLILGVITIIGYFISIPSLIQGINDQYIKVSQLLLLYLDLITITVPPALPTCLQIGITFALKRLNQKKIYCIQPQKVNIAGNVSIMCFDKTGTLTEDGLNIFGLLPIFYMDSKIKFQPMFFKMSKLWMPSFISISSLIDQT